MDRRNILLIDASSSVLPFVLYALRQEFSGKIVSVTGGEGLARFLTDEHYIFDKAAPEYLENIKRLCVQEQIALIMPLSMQGRLFFQEHPIGVPVFASSSASIQAGHDKESFFRACQDAGVPFPTYFAVDNITDLKEKAKQLGYPAQRVVIKPAHSSGSKGLRILNAKSQTKASFYSKREIPEISLSNLHRIVGDHFPPLIVQEYLPGEEYTIDCLRWEQLNLAFPRQRLEVKNGVTSVGQMVCDEQLIKHAQHLAETLDLTTVFGFQFKRGADGIFKAIDCNPRVQGTMIMSVLAGANIIAKGIQCMLDGTTPVFDVDWNMRYYRHFSGIGVSGSKVIRLDARGG